MIAPMRSFTLLILLGCSACSIGAADPAAKPAESGDLLPQIRELVGTAACSDSSQCHALALGARACGGPQSYLPWSSAKTDGTALRALGQRYQEQQRAQNAASGLVSDCRFIPDPGAQCRAGTCQLNTSGPGAV
jgi:hypothetical protein